MAFKFNQTPVNLGEVFKTFLKGLLPASAFIYLFSLFFPWVSGPPLRIDDAWQLAMHAAFQHHLQFGRDLVIIFGPWGLLYGGYCPPTFPIAATAWAVLAFVFWWSAWRVAGHFSVNQIGAWLWFIGFAGIAGMPADQNFDVRMAGWSWLLLLLYFFVEERRFSARQSLLVITSGMLVLTKFTGMMGMTAAVMVIAADQILRERRFPWILPLFAGSILFFWVAAGQSLSLLRPFFHYSTLLAGGYTEAMMLTPVEEMKGLEWPLMVSAILLAVMAYVSWRRYRFAGAYPLIGLGAILFLNLKHVGGRYDHVHEVTGVLVLLLIALGCLAVGRPVWQKKGRWVGTANVLALGVVGLFCSSTFDRCYREEGLAQERLWVNFAWTLNIHNILAPARLIGDPDHLRKIYDQNLAEVRRKYPLPRIEGTVDVYPWNQAVPIAYDMAYEPRPVIQSCLTYAPQLAELNAAHLRGPDAPDCLLFDLDPMNNNFPATEDGLSWLEFLTRYDVKDVTSQFVILHRSAQPREYHLTALADLPLRLNEPVAITTNAFPIWADLEIKQTLWGGVVATCYKPPVLNLAVSLQDGRRLVFRIVPGMARSGFLLSPLIQDKSSFVQLNSPDGWSHLTGWQVKSATLFAATPSGTTACYQSVSRLRLYRLEVPGRF